MPGTRAARGSRPQHSEDRVDERSERLDGRREDQHEAEYAEKYGQGQEPAVARLAPPGAADEIRDRAARRSQHDQTPPDPARLPDHHATSSFSGRARTVARFDPSVGPATSTSS